MTEILVRSIEDEGTVVQPVHLQTDVSSIQMQGFAADQSPLSLSWSSAGGATDDRRQAAASSLGEMRDRASSRASQPTSVRSEPDLDTIMPLPHSTYSRRGDGYSRIPGEGSDTDSASDGEGHSPASFTTVEVGTVLSAHMKIVVSHMHIHVIKGQGFSISGFGSVYASQHDVA